MKTTLVIPLNVPIHHIALFPAASHGQQNASNPAALYNDAEIKNRRISESHIRRNDKHH